MRTLVLYVTKSKLKHLKSMYAFVKVVVTLNLLYRIIGDIVVNINDIIVTLLFLKVYRYYMLQKVNSNILNQYMLL